MIKNNTTKISICLCTYHRPLLLERCLKSLLAQKTSRRFEIVVVDNDVKGLAKETLDRIRSSAEAAAIPCNYTIEPVRNISLARNRSLAVAKGELIAFIDDDEIADPDWLDQLCTVREKCNADGVIGPVEPIYPEVFPNWMRESNIFRGPRYADASPISTDSLYTGNALILGACLNQRPGPFDEIYGRTGGEDGELFGWLRRRGVRFFWADKAIVREHISENRIRWSWHLSRCYRYGWADSARNIADGGRIQTFLRELARFPVSYAAAHARILLNLNNPRAALLRFFCNAAYHIGKLGYFAGIRLEGYRPRNDSYSKSTQ